MNEEKAEATAAALGGETWHSGGGIWLVLIRRKDGKLVVVSDEAVCEYESQEQFDEGEATNTIFLG